MKLFSYGVMGLPCTLVSEVQMNPSCCQTMLILESLEMILLRTASDLSHFNMVGNAIVKKTVSGYMKLVQGSFHSNNHKFVRQCLSFLSALVSQGPEAAREVFSCIQVNKALSGLAKRKDKKACCIPILYFQSVLELLGPFLYTYISLLKFSRENPMSAWLLSSLCCPFWCLEIVLLSDKYYKLKVICRYDFKYAQCALTCGVLVTFLFGVCQNSSQRS